MTSRSSTRCSDIFRRRAASGKLARGTSQPPSSWHATQRQSPGAMGLGGRASMCRRVVHGRASRKSTHHASESNLLVVASDRPPLPQPLPPPSPVPRLPPPHEPLSPAASLRSLPPHEHLSPAAYLRSPQLRLRRLPSPDHSHGRPAPCHALWVGLTTASRAGGMARRSHTAVGASPMASSTL